MLRIVRLAALVLLLLALAASTAGARTRTFTLGFSGDGGLDGSTAQSRQVWIPDAVHETAQVVRVGVSWAAVAPATRPPGFVATDPASPGYQWGAVDQAVRSLSAAGIKVLLTVTQAPGWAQGPNRPSSAQPGTWRPSAADYGQFATAIATRYDGHYPDPENPGAFLPRVRLWQGWNEANLPNFLTPQWVRSGHRWVAEAPVIFRGLMNAFYASVKRVARSNFVLLGGTAPYGDPPGGQRIQPVEFYRVLFCLKHNRRLSPTRCPNPVHADGVDHHPYGIAGPYWHAVNADDVAVPDIYKIVRVLRAAQRDHHIVPRRHTAVWTTELSWDSRPPDPHGVPVQRQARWCEEAMYVLWKQGVSTMLWLQLVDAPPIPSYAATNQGGLYYLDARAKPAATAFRFPLVAHRLSRSRVQIWGRSPESGTVRVEVRRGGHWGVLFSRHVRARGLFVSTRTMRGHAVLRAQVGSQTSLTWSQS